MPDQFNFLSSDRVTGLSARTEKELSSILISGRLLALSYVTFSSARLGNTVCSSLPGWGRRGQLPSRLRAPGLSSHQLPGLRAPIQTPRYGDPACVLRNRDTILDVDGHFWTETDVHTRPHTGPCKGACVPPRSAFQVFSIQKPEGGFLRAWGQGKTGQAAALITSSLHHK